jgi:tetratricopeptide (TPR) repeat protein
MSKPQWITAGIAIFIVIGLYAATQKKVFGIKEFKPVDQAAAHESHDHISIDSILIDEKKKLAPEQVKRISFLEHSISRGDVKDQQLHIYHQLARFWKDTAMSFAPFAWYTAEAARLENSEKSLTFAARLFLNGLSTERNHELREWHASQAKDLYERSLKLNPANDSASIELGSVIVYGGIEQPMKGVAIINKVLEKDPSNIYAHMTLADASLVSGQLDKAVERFKKVVQIQPDNLRAIFGIAETSEQMGEKKQALEWYEKSLPHVTMPEMRQEVEARIARLKK